MRSVSMINLNNKNDSINHSNSNPFLNSHIISKSPSLSNSVMASPMIGNDTIKNK